MVAFPAPLVHALQVAAASGAASAVSVQTPFQTASPPNSFLAHFTCAPDAKGEGYALPEGFDTGAGFACRAGALAPATPGTPAYLGRSIGAGAPGTEPIVQAAVVARIRYTPGPGESAVGWNAAPAGERNTDPHTHLLTTVGAGGFALDAEGVVTTLLPGNGAPNGQRGHTDSGFGLGWTPPAAGDYDVALIYPGDGSALVSVSHPDTVNNSAAFRLSGVELPACSAPCGQLGAVAGIQNFELDETAASDSLSGAGYALSTSAAGRIELPVANEGNVRPGFVVRWFLDAKGDPCTAAGTGCMNVFAWVPPAYEPQRANRWVLVMHGYGEDAQVVQQEYNNGGADVSDTLYRQGFVLVSIENVDQNCYGNQQCLDDVTHAMATASTALSLEPAPYMMADSMGGFQMLNAIAKGVVKPRAIAGFCINTDLGWDFRSGNAGPAITAAFALAGTTYDAATAGFDPQLASGDELANLAAVPMLLLASTGDPVVNMAANSTAFAARMKGAGGTVQVVGVPATAHVPPVVFQGATVAAFFNAH